MAARKKQAAPDPEPEPQAQDPELDVQAEPAGVDEQLDDTELDIEPAAPVRRIRIAGAEPVRAGGHVLTERGWVRES